MTPHIMALLFPKWTFLREGRNVEVGEGWADILPPAGGGNSHLQGLLGSGGHSISLPTSHSLVQLFLPSLPPSSPFSQLLGHAICLCSPFPRDLAPFIETFK